MVKNEKLFFFIYLFIYYGSKFILVGKKADNKRIQKNLNPQKIILKRFLIKKPVLDMKKANVT